MEKRVLSHKASGDGVSPHRQETGTPEPVSFKRAELSANRGGTAGFNVLVLGLYVRWRVRFFILWR
jgi:hypothetical protein